MLTLEFDAPRTSSCECCGGTTTTLTRVVYKNDDAYAVYHAMYSDSHPERIVKLAIALGEWGEGSTPEERTAFALDLRAGRESFEVMVTDADQSPWADASPLGKMLNRVAALENPLVHQVFKVIDHVIIEDVPVKDYLVRS